MIQSSSGETTESLTELPQLLGCCVILGLVVEISHSAVGEVASVEGFEPLLESTVQSCLGSLDGVLEEKSSHGRQDDFQEQTGVPGELRIDSTCKIA